MALLPDRAGQATTHTRARRKRTRREPITRRRYNVPLDKYYRESVVGGPGAFVIAVEEFESFGLAVRRKLIREISDLPPAPRMAA